MRNVITSLVAVTAIFTAASAASAAMITYPNQTSGGITVSNITETNNTVSDKYYGAPTLSGTVLTFPITGGTLTFAASSSGINDSDLLDVKLSFDVSSQTALPVAAFLNEIGDYFGSGIGATGGDSASILLFGPNNSLLASGTGVYNAPAATLSTVWQNNISAVGTGTAVSMHVVIDNVLHTSSTGVADYANIEKKGVAINLGSGSAPPPIPEPASLGILALGGMALLTRRRKA